MSTARPRYLVTLEAMPGATPGDARLRLFLKRALRGFGLRCLDAREVDGAPPAPAVDSARIGGGPTPSAGRGEAGAAGAAETGGRVDCAGRTGGPPPALRNERS
jgi:hypothetical protein